MIISIVDDLTLLHGVQSIAESLSTFSCSSHYPISLFPVCSHTKYISFLFQNITPAGSVFVLHAYNIPPVILSIKCCVLWLCLCYRLQRIKKGITRDQVISLFPELSILIVALKRTVVIFPLSIIIKYRCYGNK